MRLHVCASADAACEALAGRLVEQLAAQPALVLGLPTGRTPLGLYRQLVARHRAGQVHFTQATAFQLDEFTGLPPDEPASFWAYLQRHLFAHVDFQPARLHRLQGWAEDAAAECARYSAALVAAGGLDVALLGLGDDGHLAFNEPADALQPRAHRARLTRATREANAGLFGGQAHRVPLHALTLGMAELLTARHVHLLVTGGAKATVLQRALHGPLTPQLPASLLQLHPSLEVWADAAAAGPGAASGG